MSQFLRPDGTHSLGSWADQAGGTTDVHLTIDETSADDADFARSPTAPTNAAVTFTLSNGSTPQSGTQTLRVRGRKSGGGEVHNLTIDVMEGDTVVQTFTQNDISGTTWATWSYTVTNAITDWTNVRVRISANTDGVGTDRRSQVSFVEFEVPDVGATVYNESASETGTGTPAATGLAYALATGDEAGTGADAGTGPAYALGIGSEAGTGADLATGPAYTLGVSAETGTGTDAGAGLFLGGSAASESATGADQATGPVTTVDAASEAGTGADAAAGAARVAASPAESGTGTDATLAAVLVATSAGEAGTGADTASAARIVDLTDDFADGTIDPKWPDIYGTVTEAGGRLVLSAPVDDWAALDSAHVYDITGATVSWEWIYPGSFTGDTWNAWTSAPSASYVAAYTAQNRTVLHFEVYSFVTLDYEYDDTVAFDPAAMRWVRIQHNDTTGEFKLYTSANGSTWALRSTLAGAFMPADTSYSVETWAYGQEIEVEQIVAAGPTDGIDEAAAEAGTGADAALAALVVVNTGTEAGTGADSALGSTIVVGAGAEVGVGVDAAQALAQALGGAAEAGTGTDAAASVLRISATASEAGTGTDEGAGNLPAGSTIEAHEPLTAPEADSITDHSGLSLRFTQVRWDNGVPRAAIVYWAQLVVPEAVGIDLAAGEAGTGGDAATGRLVGLGVGSEAGALLDAVLAALVTSAEPNEIGSAVDAAIAALRAVGLAVQQTTGIDAGTAALRGVAEYSEVGTGTEDVEVGGDLSDAIDESGSGADDVVEQGSLVGTADDGMTASDAVIAVEALALAEAVELGLGEDAALAVGYILATTEELGAALEEAASALVAIGEAAEVLVLDADAGAGYLVVGLVDEVGTGTDDAAVSSFSFVAEAAEVGAAIDEALSLLLAAVEAGEIGVGEDQLEIALHLFVRAIDGTVEVTAAVQAELLVEPAVFADPGIAPAVEAEGALV